MELSKRRYQTGGPKKPKRAVILAESPTRDEPTYELDDYLKYDIKTDKVTGLKDISRLPPVLQENLKEYYKVIKLVNQAQDARAKSYQSVKENTLAAYEKYFPGKNPKAAIEFAGYSPVNMLARLMGDQIDLMNPKVVQQGFIKEYTDIFNKHAKYQEELDKLYEKSSGRVQAFYDESNNPMRKVRRPVFTKEAENLKAFYKRTDPSRQVDILPVYKEDEAKIADTLKGLSKEDQLFIFGHAGDKYAGLENQWWADQLSKSQYGDCYLGSCGTQKIVDSSFSKLKNFHYRPKGSWWGVNPNATNLTNAMFSRVDNPIPQPEDFEQKPVIKTPKQGVDYNAINLTKQFGGSIDFKSLMGYADGSPFRGNPYIDIQTPEGLIDMSNTSTDLLGIDNLGNIKRMKAGKKNPYKFEGNMVREIPMQTGGLKGYIPPSYSDHTRVFNPNLVPAQQQEGFLNQRTKDDAESKRFLKDYYTHAIKNVPFYRDLSPDDSMSVDVDRYKKYKDVVDRLSDETMTNPSKYDSLFYFQNVPEMIDSPSLKRKLKEETTKAYQDFREEPLRRLEKPDSLVFTPKAWKDNKGKELLGLRQESNNLTKVADEDRLQTLIHERAHKADISKRWSGQKYEKDLRKNLDVMSMEYGEAMGLLDNIDYFGDFSERQARHRSTQYWLTKNMPGYDFKKSITNKEFDFLMKNKSKLPSDVKQLLVTYQNDPIKFTNYINSFEKGGKVRNPYMQYGGMTGEQAFRFLFDDEEEEVKKEEQKPTAPSADEIKRPTDELAAIQALRKQQLNDFAMNLIFSARGSNPYAVSAEALPEGNPYIKSSGEQGSRGVGEYGKAIYGELSRSLGYAPVANSIFRTRKQQNELIASGAPAAKNSYHLTGNAIDLKPQDWNNLGAEQQEYFRSKYSVVYHNNHYHIEPRY